MQYFGDEQCTLMLGTSSMDTYMNICEVETANTDYAYAAYESFMCTSSGTPVAPSGAINGL